MGRGDDEAFDAGEQPMQLVAIQIADPFAAD